jgi:hypothetical protein
MEKAEDEEGRMWRRGGGERGGGGGKTRGTPDLTHSFYRSCSSCWQYFIRNKQIVIKRTKMGNIE